MPVARSPIANSSRRDGVRVDDNLGSTPEHADAASTTSSSATSLSTASTFAEGDRKIDAYLRETTTAIHAVMTQWLARRKDFREKMDDKVDENDETMCEAAEDIDQLRVTAGMNLQTWVEPAKAELDLNDDGDRHILHRVSTFTDRQCYRFEKYSYIMPATPEMELHCTMPSTCHSSVNRGHSNVNRGRSSLTLAHGNVLSLPEMDAFDRNLVIEIIHLVDDFKLRREATAQTDNGGTHAKMGNLGHRIVFYPRADNANDDRSENNKFLVSTTYTGHGKTFTSWSQILPDPQISQYPSTPV